MTNCHQLKMLGQGQARRTGRIRLTIELDPEIFQQRLILVLGGEAGVGEVAVDVAPFA